MNVSLIDRLRRAGPRKYFIVPIIVLSLTIIAVLYITIALQVEIQPTRFQLLVIDGGPDNGTYTVLFALQDANFTNGPSNGYVKLTIHDANGALLYDNEFIVRTSDFRTYDDPIHGGRVIGYSWQVPVANVSSGMPDPQGYGSADLTFLSFGGRSVTETLKVKIPSMPLL
jgi:hypothetical protein